MQHPLLRRSQARKERCECGVTEDIVVDSLSSFMTNAFNYFTLSGLRILLHFFAPPWSFFFRPFFPFIHLPFICFLLSFPLFFLFQCVWSKYISMLYLNFCVQFCMILLIFLLRRAPQWVFFHSFRHWGICSNCSAVWVENLLQICGRKGGWGKGETGGREGREKEE